MSLRTVVMPVPTVAPFGTEFTPEYAQEVWDAFVKPDQDAQVAQSVEMRMLMALLRAFAQGEVSEGRAGSDTTPVGPISPDGTVTGGSSRPTPLADLRDRFRQVLADHGRVSIDELKDTVEDLVRAVTA